MMLLRLISWPYFRKHVLRTMLTMAGIVLGVAGFVGMHTANQSVLDAFSHTVDRIAGKTEPWSTNFDIYSVPADGSSAPKNLTAANLAWDAEPLPSADGKTLYYLAMQRPGFEAARFGVLARDLATGSTA